MTIQVLDKRQVVLGVTGSIACFKAVELASKLTQAGAIVDVFLSRGAANFITPLTFRSLTHRPVVTDQFDPASEMALEHVALARRADIVVAAPATAHVIAKMALGLADDALTTTILATTAPILVAPAMDANMFQHPTVQENLARLKARGVHIAGPVEGRLASGLVGAGRMVEPQELVGHIRWVLGQKGDLAGRTLVVTAGGTQEPIDPVRMVTNRSSGKMGYAVAEAGRDRGAKVVLVTAPTALEDPVGVQVVRVGTAQEMQKAVLDACHEADALIMAAAVSDYRPVSFRPQKVKKTAETWTLEMMRTPEILGSVEGDLVKVGFAAETEELLTNARKKLTEKGLHLIAANDVSAGVFGADTNKVVLLDRQGEVEELPLMTKYEVAHRILDRVAALLPKR